MSDAILTPPIRVARPRRGEISPSVVAVVLASVTIALVAGDWIAGAGLWVLWAGWHFLPAEDGPPVLPLAFTFQWVQITAGVYYLALTGRPVPAVYSSDYRSMVLIGLGCLLALLAGLLLGLRMVARRPRPASRAARRSEAGKVAALRPASRAARGSDAVGRTTVARLPMGWTALIACYVASIAITGTVQELAWEIPQLTQGILALTFARFALLYLMFQRLSAPRIRWGLIGLLLAVEIALGFTGYFAGFREPMMMAAAALMCAFDRRRVAHWITLAVLLAAMVGTGVLWIGIRTEYRQDLEVPSFADSREARAQRVADLSSRWVSNSADQMVADVEAFVDRLWAVYYPALVLDRVPLLLPHENGAILGEALWHLITPRVLFPDKGVLPSDSEMVRKYSGVLVAGTDEGTSIAFGYAAESYVDFGLPWMFIPVLVYGALMGMAYHALLRLIRHDELAVALVTVVFWLSLSLFERSWIKMLGLSLTLVVYLGGAALALDRFLLWRRAVPRRRAAPRVLAAGRGPRSA